MRLRLVLIAAIAAFGLAGCQSTRTALPERPTRPDPPPRPAAAKIAPAPRSAPQSLTAVAPAPVAKPAPRPVEKPVERPKAAASPAEQAGCKAPESVGRSVRFVGRHTLRSGVSVCLYSKPDLMLSVMPPLGPQYVQLLPRANGGDAEAQFRLAVIANLCSNTPATAELLKTTVATAIKTRRYLGGTRVEDPQDFEARMRQDYADCDGVESAQRARSQHWARTAAAAGLLDAQESLAFMARPGNVYYTWNRDTKENNARDAAFYKETMGALIAARDGGSVVAMLSLAGRYAQYQSENPPWERENFDPLKAYAHFSAYDQVQQAIKGKRREPIKGTVVGAMRDRLTPQQLASAEAMAKSFLASPKCCVITD